MPGSTSSHHRGQDMSSRSGDDPHFESQERDPAADDDNDSTTADASDGELVVDRGARAWATAGGCFLAMFATQGYVAGYGPYQAYYESIFPQVSPSNISWIGSVMLSAGYLFAIPAAVMTDVLGPQLTLAVASVFVVVGTVMSSLAHSFYQVLLSHGICVGIGIGLAFLPTVSLPNQHFKRYRGVVVSSALGGSSIGGVVWPVIFNRMINYSRVSYGWTQRAMALIQLVCLAASVLMVRPNVKVAASRKLKMSSYPVGRALKSLQVDAFFVGALLCLAGVYVPNFYMVPYAQALGATPTTAFYLTSLLSASTFIGRFVWGGVSDRLGHSNTLVFCTVISAVMVFSWSSITSMAGLWAWASLYGLFYGPAISLQTPALILNVPGRHDVDKLKVLPTYISLMCTLAAVGALGGNPVAGRLLANNTRGSAPEPHDYHSMTWFGGSLLLVSAALFAYARLSATRQLKA
ncbi:putative Riboflavin transporter MCH5 (putative) [Pseudozyma hubeiensis]|nr:putative Riboflavin transporter MCH5 (putative) [Pseudozyma hubeiensis]